MESRSHLIALPATATEAKIGQHVREDLAEGEEVRTTSLQRIDRLGLRSSLVCDLFQRFSTRGLCMCGKQPTVLNSP